jgi:simple sugar transport system permease protein
MNDFVTILASTIAAGTPIIYALIGDLIGQRAGVISLSVEGSMLMGACLGYGVAFHTNNLFLAALVAMVGGGLIGILQAFLAIDRKANMMAAGFVLMFFAQGLTAFYGRSFIGVSYRAHADFAIPLLSKIPYLGPILFQQDILTFISFLLPVGAFILLSKTKLGLVISSVGEKPDVTLAYGYNPRLIQYGAVIFAGMLAGLGGLQMSAIYTKSWANNLINGRGFIASALVILCSWKPLRAYMAAYVFGVAQALLVYLQVRGVPISMYVTMMLPYLFTLGALAIISSSKKPSMPEQIKVQSERLEQSR